MLSPEQFFAFLLAASVITVAPGPDNMMILSLGMARGRRPAIAFGLGCALGCLSHTLLAVVGVSALIAASPQAFMVLKGCGGLYLIWLGFNALRSTGGASLTAEGSDGSSVRRYFFKGVFANAINPKVILFFLSFLPQFVLPVQGDLRIQMALLGLTFTAQAAVIFGLFGYFSGTIGGYVITRPRLSLWMDRITGLVFLGLGLRLILAA